MAISNCPNQSRGRKHRLPAIADAVPSPAKCSPRPSVTLIEETRRLMERTIEFVNCEDFQDIDFEEKIEATQIEAIDEPPQMKSSAPGIAFLSSMVQRPLLTPEREKYLFLRMNFVKARAERYRRMLDLRISSRELVKRINDDLETALELRNQIVEGNLRLVVATAKKLSGSLELMSELISEGMSPLIRAVELFDVALGNRFSTYATWAVRNQMLRRLKRIGQTLEFSPGEDAPSLENLPDKRDPAESEDLWPQSRGELVNRLLSSLSERERSIVAARFGLQGQPRGQSLAAIAERIGLCKERVRQILLQSLVKLRSNMMNDEPRSLSNWDAS